MFIGIIAIEGEGVNNPFSQTLHRNIIIWSHFPGILIITKRSITFSYKYFFILQPVGSRQSYRLLPLSPPVKHLESLPYLTITAFRSILSIFQHIAIGVTIKLFKKQKKEGGN